MVSIISAAFGTARWTVWDAEESRAPAPHDVSDPAHVREQCPRAAGEAPSWVAAMLGHPTPEMLFTIYARFIPNRTRCDGSALLARMMTGPAIPGLGMQHVSQPL